MRRLFAITLALSLICVPGLQALPQDQYQDQGNFVEYSPQQLDNLLAPIALYPDPLLAQVLPAATFPDQIDEAARYVRAFGQNGIDVQSWDVSVKAVAHYPTVLYMMADKIDWTSALGQAYVNQSTEVMSSVQRLRAMARSQGNLVSGPQIEVIEDAGFIQIWPGDPRYIYVPVYDPAIVYFRQPFWGVAVGFSIGFFIGSWLNYDCDWHGRRIFYTGWRGGGWIARSRPHIRITNVYVDNRFEHVNVNRRIVDRHVNFDNVNRNNNVHRDVNFDNHDRSGRIPRPDSRVNNQIINRNIPNDTRVDDFRGREPRPTPPAGRTGQPGGVDRGVPPTGRPGQPGGVDHPTPPAGRPGQPGEVDRTNPPTGRPGQPGGIDHPTPPAGRPGQASGTERQTLPGGRTGQPSGIDHPAPPPGTLGQRGRGEPTARQPQQQPAPPTKGAPQTERNAPRPFGRNEGNFPPPEASRRGQTSRATPPSVPSRPAPSQPPRPTPNAPSRATPNAPSRPAPSDPAARPSGRHQ